MGRRRLSLDRPKGDVEPKLGVVWDETGNDAVLRLSLISMGSHMAWCVRVCVCARACFGAPRCNSLYACPVDRLQKPWRLEHSGGTRKMPRGLSAAEGCKSPRCNQWVGPREGSGLP